MDKTETDPLLVSEGNKPRTGYVKYCICGKKIYIRPSALKKNNYCSKKCSNKGQLKSKPKNCIVCGKEFYRPLSQEKHRGVGKFCSKKCKGVDQKARYQKIRSDNFKYPKKMTTYKRWVWKHFSDFIRERDNWTCFTCGKVDKGPAMHAGHFISRVRSATLFDEKNVHAQCYACNIGKKGNAGEYAYRIIQIYGQPVLDELVQKSRQTHKFTFEELESIYQRSKSERKRLLEEHSTLI